MIINIVGGSGTMGRVHKKIFEKFGHTVMVSGRKSEISIEDACKKSEITIISVPINVTEDVIKKFAPFCKAIVDFTSLKKFPLEAMLKYSSENCEVAGLHPLYGEVDSINGKTVVFCKTPKTGKRCYEIIDCIKKEGAIIKEMDAEKHDRIVSSLNQILRVKILTSFGLTLKESSFTVDELYSLAPPPTKKIIELLARQLNEKNDEIYKDIMAKDVFSDYYERKFFRNIKKVSLNYKNIAKNLREFYGDDLIKELSETIKKEI
jgi:prephenate dehydrogenase